MSQDSALLSLRIRCTPDLLPARGGLCLQRPIDHDGLNMQRAVVKIRSVLDQMKTLVYWNNAPSSACASTPRVRAHCWVHAHGWVCAHGWVHAHGWVRAHCGVHAHGWVRFCIPPTSYSTHSSLYVTATWVMRFFGCCFCYFCLFVLYLVLWLSPGSSLLILSWMLEEMYKETNIPSCSLISNGLCSLFLWFKINLKANVKKQCSEWVVMNATDAPNK